MEKIKNSFFKILNSSYLPFVAFALLILFFHSCMHVGFGDDEFFRNVLNDQSMFGWLMSRYNTWSSRVVIEFFLALIAKNRILWRVLDTFVMVLGAVSISKIFNCKQSAETNWTICAFVLCMPVTLYTSAGWVATTLNYSWAAFLGLFSMVPIKKILYHEKINWYEYIFYFAAMIYAANQEQMCLILLAVYVAFSCYMFYRDKKISWFLIAGTVLNLAMIIFILTCPGNANRKAAEVVNWFPDYNDMSFFRKIEMGVSSTLFEFIMKPNFVFLIFSLILFLCVNSKFRNTIYSFIAMVPIASSVIFGFLTNILGEEFSKVVEIKNSMTPYGTGIHFVPRTWVPDIILFLVCAAIIISLYMLFDDKKMFLFAVFILLLGFGSRIIMSFSPTIWASGLRTFMFMYLPITACSVVLYQKLKSDGSQIAVEILNYIIFILSAMSYANMLYLM